MKNLGLDVCDEIAENAKAAQRCLDATGKIKDLCLNGCFMFEKTFPSSVFFTFAMQNK